MSDTDQASFKGWARVEIMGHQFHIGLVTTEAYGDAVLFRVDQPEIPESEETLTETQYVEGQMLPAGTVVKRARIEAFTTFLGAKSLYRMIPCTQEVAIKAIIESQRRPLIAVKLPGARALTPVVPIDRDFTCCAGNSEDGHDLSCPKYDEDGPEGFEESR